MLGTIGQVCKRTTFSIFEKGINCSKRQVLADTRVHCILYFIPPNGQKLKQLDVQALKKLSEIANVVPIIAKSDSLTLDERSEFKNCYNWSL